MKKIRLWKMQNSSQFEVDNLASDLSKLLLNGGDLIVNNNITVQELEIAEGDEDFIVEIRQEEGQSIISVKKVEFPNE